MKGIHNKYSTIFIFVILLFCAVFVSSCSKFDTKDSETDIAISFNSSIGKTKSTNTRSIVSSGSDIESFGVFTQIDYGSGFNSWLENELVEKDGQYYSFVNDKYWLRKCKYHFSAIHPFINESSVEVVASSNGQSGYLYKIPYTTTSQTLTDPIDLMVAHADEITTTESISYSVPEAVPLEFKHKLSKVTLNIYKSIENNSDQIKITGLSLSGINTKGVCYSSAMEDSALNKWEVDSEPQTLSSSNLSAEVGVSSPYSIDMLYIPQNIYTGSGDSKSGKVNLEISYTFQNNGSGTVESYTIEKTIPIDNIDAWLEGEHITYKLTITVENDIIFSTPTVNTWGIQQSGGTIIIK